MVLEPGPEQSRDGDGSSLWHQLTQMVFPGVTMAAEGLQEGDRVKPLSRKHFITAEPDPKTQGQHVGDAWLKAGQQTTAR